MPDDYTSEYQMQPQIDITEDIYNPMRDRANAMLLRTDYRIWKAVEVMVASPEWCAWRERLREIVNYPNSATELPPEPPFGAPASPASLMSRIAELEAENARLKEPAPEPHNFPANMSDKLTDWAEPAGEDLQQLMAGEETLAAAVERMTPGLDELLDMASALSEASFEQAIVTIPVEKRNTWTERLFDERARLRLKRNTDEENLDRENLISRVATVFTKVGSKR